MYSNVFVARWKMVFPTLAYPDIAFALLIDLRTIIVGHNYPSTMTSHHWPMFDNHKPSSTTVNHHYYPSLTMLNHQDHTPSRLTWIWISSILGRWRGHRRVPWKRLRTSLQQVGHLRADSESQMAKKTRSRRSSSVTNHHQSSSQRKQEAAK